MRYIIPDWRQCSEFPSALHFYTVDWAIRRVSTCKRTPKVITPSWHTSGKERQVKHKLKPAVL